MSEIVRVIGLCKEFTDELDKLGFEWRIQARKEDRYLDINTEGFKALKMR